tara:strand:- start:33 stop:461 length:429 start_codon:yes stop_codon:yes gene_type:complete
MKLVLISIFLLGLTITINFINILPVSGEIYLEKKIANNHLAEKYCDSIQKNLFKGLDKESTLKYEYFFSSIPYDLIEDEKKFLEIFKTDVKSICSYEVSESNEKELKTFLKIYFKTNRSTPKTKVEVINPRPTNTAMIPVLR